MNHTPARQHRTSASGGIHSCEAPAPIFLDAEIPFGTSRRYELFTVAGAPPVSSIHSSLAFFTSSGFSIILMPARARDFPAVSMALWAISVLP